MQRYHVDDGAGHTLTLEGDSPPTEQELEEIFSTHFSNSSPMGGTPVTSYVPSPASLPGGFMDPGDVRSGEFTKSLFVDAPQDISAGLHAIMEPVERMASAGVNVFGLRLTEPGKSVIPGVEPEPGSTGVIPSLRRAAAGFTTPGTLVTLPFAAESKALQGAFGIGAAASIPQSLQQLAQAQTGAEARGALTDIGISGAIAGGIGKSLTRERNPYASSKSKAAEVYGALREQSIEGQTQVPAEEGGQGVQPSNAQRQGPQAQVSLDNRISDLQKDPEATGQKFAGMDANGAPRYEPARTNARKIQELNDLLAKRELRDKLTPEESAYIDSEREAIDTPIEIVPEAREGDPFAANRRAQGQFMGINPEKGTIEIYPEEFKKWLKDVPEHLHQGAVKARLWEEKIHLWVMKHLGNAAADAYWNSISRVERMINEYRYSKSTGTARVKRGISDTMMGHEALRFRMQQLARMTPSELAETAGAEHWTLKGLTVVETAIRAARKAIGTAGSEAQRDILDKIQNSLNIAKGIVGGDQVRPGAVRRDTGEPDLEKVGNDPQDVADAAEGAFFSLRQLRASNADQYAVLDRYEALTDFLDERIDKAIESNDPSRASELDGLKESISKWFSNSETPAAVRRQKSTEYKGEEMFAPDLLRASSGFAKARAAAGGDERVVADADKELYKEAQRIGQERGPAAVRRSRTDKDTISQVQADYDRLFAAPVANLDKLAQRAWYRLKGKQSPELLRAAHNVVYSNNRGENVPEFLANDAAFMEAIEARHVPPGQEQRFFAEKELSKSGFGDASAVLSDWPNRRSEVQPVDPALKRWIDRKMFPGQFPVEQGPAAIRRGLTKAEEARETARRKIYDLRQAAEAEAAGTPIEQPNLVKPPSAEHISAEEGGALPRLTPTDIEAKAKQYLEGDITTKKLTQERTGAQADKPPRVKYEHGSFDDFVKWAKNNLGTLNPEQLRDTWVDSVWNHILNASGGRLTEWRKGLGMEHNYGTRRIADAAGEPSIFETSDNKKIRESQQRYRSKVSAGIARRLIKEADQGRANLERDSITNDDIHFSSTQTKVGAFLEIRPSDAEDRTVLETILRDQARATPNDPESASRRLVLLLDKTTGKAHLVSTYNDAGRQMVTDPAGPRVKGRFSRALDQNLLRHYQPVSTVLLKDPVKAFRQTFNSVSDFMDKIGTEASRRSELGHVEYAGEASTGEFLPRGESGEPSAAPSTGRIAAPGIFRAERGSFEGAPERITDAEVGGILRHVIRESGTLESPADVRSSLAALTTKAAAGKLNGADRVAISGYRKAFKALEANFPNADREDLLDVLSDRIYENYDTAKSDQDFIKRGLAEFQAKSSEPSGRTPRTQAPPQENPAGIRRTIARARWTVTDAIRDTGSSYDEWMVNRIARKGGPVAEQAAEVFKSIIDREKQLYGELTPKLDEARRAAGQLNKATTWLHGLNKVTGYAATSRTVGAMERTIPVPPEAQGLVNMARDVNIDIGRMVMPVVPGFVAGGKFQRNPTALGYDAVRRADGDIYQKWTAGLARANGRSVREVRAMFREWKEALDTPGVDPAIISKINQDFSRVLPKVITHVRSGGQWQSVVHADLFNYLENAARRATHTRAFRESFPNDTAGRRTLHDVVTALRSELDSGTQKDVDAMISTMQGHPTDNYSNMGMLSPTEPIGSVFRTLNNTVGTMMARMVLTGQALTQMGELAVGATPEKFGMKNYLRGLAKIRQIYPQLEQDGAVNRVIYDMSFDPNAPVRSLFRQGGNVLSRAFAERAINELQEASAAATAHVVAERIKNGQLSDWERRNLPQTFYEMGFKTTEVGLLMSGDPQMLGQFQRSAAAFLTSGNRAISEGSRLGANRLFNSIFRFQSYPMMKANQFRQVAGNFAEAWTTGTKAEKVVTSERMARFLFFNTLQGALTVALTTLGYSGTTGSKIQLKEAEDESAKFLTEGFLSSMSGPLYLLWRGAQHKGILGVGEQATRMVFPYTATRELIDMANGNGQYRDLDTFSRIGKFLQSKTPGTKAIATGLAAFGVAGENRDLDTAISGFYRWRRDALGFSEREDFLNEDKRKAFRVAMRKAVDAIKKGDMDKFVDYYAEAATSVEGVSRKTAKSSLRARRILKTPDGKSITLEQNEMLRKRIGDKAVDRIEEFDAMLEALAR